jgi:hypothetical protein
MTEAFQFVALGILILATVLGFVWAARDARQSGRSPVIWVLLCLITWPVGFLIWPIVRRRPAADTSTNG